MREVILLFMLFNFLASQKGWGQIPKTITENSLADSSGAEILTGSDKYRSIHTDGISPLRAWVGSGDVGEGVWCGTLSHQALYFFTDSSTARLTIHQSGKVSVANSLDINGTTTTKILTVTGGADLAEPFQISDKEAIPAGAVVVIDEKNPGQLKLSQKSYDTHVAGVVSGAGGIHPGLTLRQEGKLGEGLNVALNGRVYALATASNGAIKPGDLLTTSDIPGHAMRATDREVSHGAIIGKAVMSLEKGKGLVLVLVNLQ